MQRRAWGVVLAMIVSAGIAGCGGGDSSSSAAEPSPSVWARPTGSPMTIEPVTTVDGAELFESDGLSVLVPDGWETRRSEQPEFVQIMVLRADDERNPVVLTILAQPGSADVVETTASVASAELAISGATDLEQHPATWSGWRYASGITGVFDQGRDGVVTDFVQVVALSGDGKVVGVTAQAPRGQLDDALSYQVLRSVRPVG